MKARRSLMRRALATDDARTVLPAPAGVAFRHPIDTDADAIAHLMLESYHGTIDAEPGDTLDTARGEVVTTIEGGYGHFMPEASFLAHEEDELVSARS